MQLTKFGRLGLSVALCLSFAINACGSDDDNPKPDEDDTVTGGSSGNAGSGGSDGDTTNGGAGGTSAGGSGGSGGSRTDGSVSTGGTAGAAGDTSDAGGAGGSGGATTTSTTTGGGTGGTGLPECDEPTDDECYDLATCSPTEETHVLNQCTDSECFAFDNEAELPLYNGGNLPPVP